MSKLDRITVDPRVCLGQPTIRGMRITISVIVKMVAAGKWDQCQRSGDSEVRGDTGTIIGGPGVDDGCIDVAVRAAASTTRLGAGE